MKVIFLDFDGVLNSEASFILERRRRQQGLDKNIPRNQTLCHVCCSNFQRILDSCPDVKIVISSTWRKCFDLDFIKEKLSSYEVDSSRVMDITPFRFSDRVRGGEISDWLEDHPEVTNYIILDDNSDMTKHMDKLIQTDWFVGLTLHHTEKAIEMLNSSK